MNGAGRSQACVVSEDKLLGIFTQRDYLMRILGRSRTWESPIADEMTRALRTMTLDQTAADGLAIMNDWWVRSVPVLTAEETLAGNLSYYELMAKITALVSEHVDDVDTTPDVRHSLTLIDFTGLHTSTPVTVSPHDSLETAAHHMKARAIGSVIVVDSHEHVIGVLTEFDLQREMACELEDLSKVRVEDVMTPDPVTLAIRSPIVTGVQEMSARGFSHVPLLGESGRPVAVASFRDIATYMEATFAALI